MHNLLVLSDIILWVLVTVMGVLILYMFRNIRTFLERLQFVNGIERRKKLDVGDFAPKFKFENQKGEKIRSTKISDKGMVLLFTKASCGICTQFKKEMVEMALEVNSTEMVNIDFENNGDNYLVNHGEVHYTSDVVLFNKFEITHVPYLIVINSKGIVVEQRMLQKNDSLKYFISNDSNNKRVI